MASGQNYPDKPLHIVAAQPGGENDFAARVIAQGLASRLGQQVIVDNAPGGAAGAVSVLNAPRDGYTLLCADTQTLVEPLLHETAYDAVRDFAAIIAATNVPFFLYAHPSVAANSVQELIALGKARPGKLKYGSGLPGASGHLAMELFKAMACVDILRVEHIGGAVAMNALAAGDVQVMFSSGHVGASYVKAGRVKVLAGASARPSALFPGLPAVAETLPGYETRQVYGVLAPAGTSSIIITQLNREMALVLNSADAKERFVKTGVEVVGGSPEDFASFMKSQTAKWDRVLRDAGLHGK